MRHLYAQSVTCKIRTTNGSFIIGFDCGRWNSVRKRVTNNRLLRPKQLSFRVESNVHRVTKYNCVYALRSKLYCYSLWATRQRSGHVIARAVSLRLPTAATRVRAQFRSCGICGGTGAGSLRVLRLPLPIFIPLTAPNLSSSIIRGWYNRPISGRRTKRAVSPHPKEKKKLN
jgi:hypothetical protein